MGIGISLILIAAGAILTWGVADTSAGLDVSAIGVILMLVGLGGLAMTLAFWSSFSPFAGSSPFRRTYAAGPPPADDNVVVAREPRQPRTVVIREEPPTVLRAEPRAPRRTVVIEDTDDTSR
ncbi:MAG: hypothetical protein ABI577_08695 [bacterium]